MNQVTPDRFDDFLKSDASSYITQDQRDRLQKDGLWYVHNDNSGGQAYMAGSPNAQGVSPIDMAAYNNWLATQNKSVNRANAYFATATQQGGRDSTILTGPEINPNISLLGGGR